MSGFLVVHVFHQRSEVRMRGHDRRRLRGIDEGCGQLAGLVDS